MSRLSSQVACLLVLSCCVFASGCGGEAGPEIAVVKGTVKLDGNPMKGVNVKFEPKGIKAESAYGATDDNGKYELKYGQKGTPGAAVGTYTVRLSPADEANYTGEPIPPKFSSESKLEATVVKGKENDIPFDLKKE